MRHLETAVQARASIKVLLKIMEIRTTNGALIMEIRDREERQEMNIMIIGFRVQLSLLKKNNAVVVEVF